MWSRQDHKDTTQRNSNIESVNAEANRLETLIKPLEDWLRTPTDDRTHVRDKKKDELHSLREALAEQRGKLKAMQGTAEGVPVAASKTAYERAKLAAILGMVAIVCGATAGVLGVFTDNQKAQPESPVAQHLNQHSSPSANQPQPLN
jgi:hypothetical protein